MSILSVDLGNGVRGSIHDWFSDPSHDGARRHLRDSVRHVHLLRHRVRDLPLHARLLRRCSVSVGRFCCSTSPDSRPITSTPQLRLGTSTRMVASVDLNAHASEGPRLAHVDALMGWKYFAGFYGRSNDVFGAVPSLHVSYPLLVILYGWRFFKTPLRIFVADIFRRDVFRRRVPRPSLGLRRAARYHLHARRFTTACAWRGIAFRPTAAPRQKIFRR